MLGTSFVGLTPEVAEESLLLGCKSSAVNNPLLRGGAGGPVPTLGHHSGGAEHLRKPSGGVLGLWGTPWDRTEVSGGDKPALLAPQIPSAVRCIHPERVLALQQQTQFLWDAYFSSVDKIVHTTLEVSTTPRGPPHLGLREPFGAPTAPPGPSQIIKDRLLPHRSRPRFLWNAPPGGLLALPDFSTHVGDFPFYYLQHGRTPVASPKSPRLSTTGSVRVLTPLLCPCPAPIAGSSPSDKFTAFIRLVSPLSQPVLRLIQAVSRSQYCAQVGGDGGWEHWGSDRAGSQGAGGTGERMGQVPGGWGGIGMGLRWDWGG